MLVLSLMRFLSLRLKPKAAKAPMTGTGPGTVEGFVSLGPGFGATWAQVTEEFKSTEKIRGEMLG